MAGRAGSANLSTNLTVFIVDDDPAVRDALGLLLGAAGYRIAVFASGAAFLQAWRPDWSGCLLIDVHMAELDGLALQRRLVELGCQIPMVLVACGGDVGMARAAFRAGALDFIDDPCDAAKLMPAIEEAFAHESRHRSAQLHSAASRERLNELTPREREVMRLVVGGHHNREIAPQLGISVRTVEVHKGRLMSKLGVDNVADLVRLSLLTGD
ncbi:response regulator transcription factor [Massilia sp. erpn]|nr:chemotaxis protein CheY [Massilia sp. NR 4-1]NVE01385.1 response regulator transcription factor [Massilia sp. BJB1822]UTY58037.1 response regulator transcription factor [Massilia sp. erpn]